jgi:predicted nucleotidyltransferase
MIMERVLPGKIPTADIVAMNIASIKEAILETIPVEKIYLFGSYAYGTPNADSDLDIYVVMKDDAPYREIEAMDKIWTAVSGKKSMPADILVIKAARFQYRLTAVTLEQEVAEKGVLLYG